MINTFTGKYRIHIAWFLFFVFYGELAASLYANAGSRRHAFLVHRDKSAEAIKVDGYSINHLSATKTATSVNEKPVGEPATAIPPQNIDIDKVDIGGPGQPEMNTFKSIGADNMVNLFTGDFSYNIPLLDIGGYPVNIFYNAGITMDQEASWVGLGWNINPGTINRNMRGLPDDYNGQDSIVKVQSIKPDLTIGVAGTKGLETVGVPGLAVNLNAGIFYNNRRGLGLEVGARGDYSIMKSLSLKTLDECTGKDTVKNALVQAASISGDINLNSQSGMTLNTGFSIYKYDKDKLDRVGLSTGVGFSSRQGFTDIRIDAEHTQYKLATYNNDIYLKEDGSNSVNVSSISFARSSFTPSIRMPLTRFNQFYQVKFGNERIGFFKNSTVSGYIQESRIDKKDMVQEKPAYGFMYYEEGNQDKNALLDFNRLNDGVYTYKVPVISVPVYTYDVFNINGEGTGGSFRGYRGNMGYMRDHDSRTRTGSFSLTLDLGDRNIFHGGTVLGGVFSPSLVQSWKSGNQLQYAAAFNKTDSIYQSFYFKNPGEKSIIDENYYDSLGKDQLIRPYLDDIRQPTPRLVSGFEVMGDDRKVASKLPVSGNAYRHTRDKRTQVITYFTAEDASRIGLDKKIYSYTEGQFVPGSCSGPAFKTAISRYNPDDPGFYRKAHHISEIDVLEADGRRYVFGIPVYQVKQKEVTFSTETSPGTANQQVSYVAGTDNSVNNDKGRDGYYQSETVNGYAHSFLLTGILSPDYVDVTDDGITDDDLGTAIRFNYSRVDKKRSLPRNGNYWNNFRWRLPAGSGMANYNEGLLADSKDDKGMYTYGEKELWYVHSIESKNMVATFRITSKRSDGKQVADENGGLSVLPGQKRLERIDLYTKADYAKYGSSARPIKTVHFLYDYSLCPGFAYNDGVPVDKNGNELDPDLINDPTNVNKNKGKLTLKAIWFSYNGNDNQVKNKYVFSYSATNPAYNSAETDRWGTYKPYLENPDDMGNHHFPYTLQDKTKSDAYASAWNLDKILLPGGALVKVKYEADDYAFVQDKRASQMTTIAGFGATSGSTPGNKLYTFDLLKGNTPGEMDHRFVFFNSTDIITTDNQVREKYLRDMKQLLLTLWVKMPRGNIGSQTAYQPMTIYGYIKSYKRINDHLFCVELEETKKGGSPIMETVMQFLKDQLPQRAYPGYDVTGSGALVQAVRSIFGVINAFTQGVMGFERDLKIKGSCKDVQLNRSFARLNNPRMMKLGGGYRVKEVTINDNWSRITNQAAYVESMYGQQYDYTTAEITGSETIVASSGVAAYEPGIGNEENPFREVLKYSERQFLGPTDHSNVELPFAETFFPSPMVGYSKVRVRSIHNKNNKNIKSAVGLQQTEFYTTRDFPVISEFTDFDPDSRHQHKPGVIQKIFNFNKKDYLTLTQGFRIVLNDMNGKMKSQSSFAENDSINPINYTRNHYRLIPKGDNKFKLDNVLPVISGADGKITKKLVGKDIEVMNDFREHFSYTYSTQIPLNVDLFKIGNFPFVLPTIFRSLFRDESMFRSATTLKVVNEYGILDSVESVDKGSRVASKNLVYDAESGDVLITRTNNEFDKPVYQFNYPAWWKHSGMEPAYRNIDVTYTKVLFRNGRIEESPQVNMKNFESGDEIYVVNEDGQGPFESAACDTDDSPSILPAGIEYRIWALDITKDSHNTTKQFIFLDRYGTPYNAADATIRIIRSGKRNLTGASVGSIVSLANPIRNVSGQERVVIDNETNVINASAAEFKERWRANDMFYAVDTVVRTIRQVLLVTNSYWPTASHSLEYLRKRGKNEPHNPYHYSSPTYFVARQHDEGGNHTKYNQKSWLNFNFSGILANSTILSAKLSMQSHGIPHAFEDNEPSHGVSNPHVSFDNHRNDFLVSRMFSAWPSNNAGWEAAFNIEPSGTANQVPKKGTTPQASSRSHLYYPLTGLDERIDITSMFTSMIRDKYEKNYATGIKLSLSDIITVDRPARVCFYNGPGGHGYQAPSIEVNYYTCNTTDEPFYKGVIANAPVYPDPGYAFCIADTIGKACFSVFSKKQMNPYVEGILGNWRGWRSYVYYGDRRESDPAVATDIRKDGIIKDYESYWSFAINTPDTLGKTGSTKWVWNAEITQYNRKGAELENRDPLGRYNAGIYGYQESLPIAVVNNSRLRLSAFDGFEDYNYKDDPCEPFCKPSKRHFDTRISTAILSETESHTGKYSARIAANTHLLMDIRVSANDEIIDPDIRIKIDSTPRTIYTVTPTGAGLLATYYSNNNFTGTTVVRSPEYPDISFNTRANNSCKDWEPGDHPAGLDCENLSATWTGGLQVVTNGNYEFDIQGTDDEGRVFVDGDEVTTAFWGGSYTRNAKSLSPSGPHTIEVRYRQFKGRGRIILFWKTPGSSVFTRIPMSQLYLPGQEALINSNIVAQTAYCVKPDTIQAINHHLIDSFNLVPGKRMIASVWTKKGGEDCKCSNYNNNITIRDAGNNIIATFAPRERIIEGWQQFEADFTVPSTAKLTLDFAASADAVFIDDLRLHPFNANMKSFVYDPVTLRLAAELDENNYASFYEYDDDGGLIRVKKETRQGIKTITETRSGIQKNIKDF